MENNMITMIPVEKLHPHPDNPRKDLGDLSELTESIRKQGVMQNLTVVPDQEGYKVIIGHRRMAAALAAGLAELPCAIRDLDERKQFEIMMEENMQRQDLTIPEQAYGFQLMFNWGYSVKDIAEKTGFSETTVNHRLQIAKLDKRILKKRQQDRDTYLQLNLSDLYELEKIQDIKKRNEILQNARDSQNLRYLVKTKIEEENRRKNKETYIKMLEEIGIRKATDQESKNRYSVKYEYVSDINLDDKLKKKLDIKQEEGLEYWYIEPKYDSERYINIFRERPKNIQPSDVEKQRDEKEAARKKLMKIKQSVDNDRKNFIREIIDGYYDGPKTSSEVLEAMERLTEAAIGMDVYLNDITIGEWITGKQRYKWTDEDQDKVSGYDLTPLDKLMILTDKRADELLVVDWDGEFIGHKYGKTEEVKLFHEVLETWGFSITDPEQIKVLDGTHELYKKEEEQ
jgi:ParB family chromosome partitioning protein